MTDARTARRLERLEAQVDVLTRALHLLTISAKPTSEWLDRSMERIEQRSTPAQTTTTEEDA